MHYVIQVSPGTEAGLSQVAVMENDEVKIISGPLENIKGVIKK